MVQINLEKEAWESIKEAVRKSPWIPEEYFMNDWLADIRGFLLNPPPKQTVITAKDIFNILKNYNCQYTKDSEGNGLSIIDVITPLPDETIEQGLFELEALAEYITDSLKI